MEKAFITVLNGSTRIEVMYNPTELDANYRVETTGEGSNVEFKRVIREDFTISLFFDTYVDFNSKNNASQGPTDVREQTKKIEALLSPTVGEGNRRTPPICIFTWATSWFQGIITNLEQKFTMFLSTGIPVRAKLKVTFKSLLTEQEELASLGLWNCPKLWTVTQNDRLDLIAYKALGNSALWQLIAVDNNIEDPLNFPTQQDIGRILSIPDTPVRK